MALFAQLYTLRWFIFVTIIALYVSIKYRRYTRLRHFHGPFGAGWSEFWHSWVILGLQSHLSYKAVNDAYGPIARIGPNELITSSPELLAHMNAVRSQYTRTWWFNASTRFEAGRDHVFSQINEEKHTKRRQQMASGYSGKENLSLEPDIDGRLQELLNLIRSKYISTEAMSKPMDLARKAQYFTLDVISTIGFGQAIGDLQADADLNDYIKSGEQGLFLVVISSALGLTKYLQWPPLARLLGPSEKDKRGYGVMMRTARRLIDSRLEKSTEGRSDMMASFIRHGLNKDDLLSESLLQILAGSDTTATAIRATMLHLITHPRVYHRLRAEVDEAVRSGAAPAAPEIVQDTTLKSLPYLQAVIREGLRIFPPVTDVVPKKVPPGGDRVTVEGKQYYLPGGTDISYNAWGVHHDKAMFGQDADLFRPERWLLEENKANEDRLVAMRRTTELIFGYGKYQCLGKPIAWLEVTKVIFEFVRNFDWALTQPDNPWRSTNYNGIWVQEQMWVTVTERDRVASSRADWTINMNARPQSYDSED